MEEKTLPWWRRALSYALGGIRSGFGLFARTPRNGAAHDDEIASGQKENPEEELSKDSPRLQPVTGSVYEVQSLPAIEQGAEEPPSHGEIPEKDEPEGDHGPSEQAHVHADGGEGFGPLEAPQESERALAPEEQAPLEAAGFSAALEATIEAEPQAGVEAVEAHEPEPVPALTVPALQSEAEALAVVEPAAEAVQEDAAEESPAPVDTPGQRLAELGISAELQHPAMLAEAPAIAAVSPVEPEAPAETSADEEAAHEFEASLTEPDEHAKPSSEIAEAEAEPEIEVVEEPAGIESPPPAEDSVPELAISSVELKEPVIEEPPEPPVEQLVTDEAESPHQAAPAAPAETDNEPIAAQDPETEPEPANLPMELNEPIPEQTAEPTPAVEVAPDSEAVANPHSSGAAPKPSTGTMPADEEPAEVPQAIPAAAHKPFIKLETRDNEADLSPFSVVVSQVYDGPLDLLLDLIRKQDIDIYDIPIARITAQFLAYVNQLKATDVDVAGEFIYTASLLIHIKSKMLLPRAPIGPDDAPEDPRRELVERLLEHERFKNAAQMLQQKQMLEAASWTNPGMREFQDDVGAEPEIAADTVDLVRVFRDILERARNRPVINVEEDSVTVGQMIQFLSRRLTMEDKPVALRRLLSHTRSERALIAMFLALLELVRLQAILLRQDRAFSEIFIKKHTAFESVMNEGLANARDDWR